jgi:enamine deaminase RidA (YjgF/YER057c/UK114 family)
MTAEERLSQLGIILPTPPTPAGLYSPAVQTGPLLYVSGQIPSEEGTPLRHGRCGESVSIDEAAALARICALNALGIVRQVLGTLDRVSKVVRVAGYVAGSADFVEHPRVVNGASQLLLDIFGEAGRHARIAIGVHQLPFGVPVEVEFLFETLGR